MTGHFWRASGPGGMPLERILAAKEMAGGSSAVALARFGLLAAAYPIKRTFDRPFGRVIIRYGETGNEENFIDTRTIPERSILEETFRPTRDGELFVYLNKPVSGYSPGLFRDVNAGNGKDPGLSYPQMRGWRSGGRSFGRAASRRPTNDKAAKRRPVG